ncbi:hypothetical protein B0H19DRAFT_1060806 [Mycena capillaripes]|nr:hypothetical protein B0H19DRAFT_1060806 [Mycena capillaripes]
MNYPGLWFEDGDIIIYPSTTSAESPSFLVHKHRLSVHSPIFSEIFHNSCAVQQESIEAVEDVQILQVNDPVKDLAVLLRCLYYPLNMPFNREEPTVDVDLGGLLRLCRKYQISHLAASVIYQLKFEWPTSLSIWEEHETRIRKLGIAHANAPQGQINGQYLDDRFPEPASIINIAREFGIPELLPVAFYTLSLISPSVNYDTFHAPAAWLLPECAARLARGTRSARWTLLSPADLLCVAKGQDQLRSQKTLTKVFEKPTRSADCTPGCDALFVALRDLAEETHDILGALTYLRLYISEPERAPKMKICPGCAKGVCNIISALRLHIWLNLPRWFGVPDVEFTP